MGEGTDREKLEQYIKQHHLETCVRLSGFHTNPYPYLAKADLFVCSSRAEGYSTVITEALILGLPIITTRCAGMQELLGEMVSLDLSLTTMAHRYTKDLKPYCQVIPA